MSEFYRDDHCYLGDGVYAQITPDDVILRTDDHRDDHCRNKIYLEKSVIKKLIEFIKLKGFDEND